MEYSTFQIAAIMKKELKKLKTNVKYIIKISFIYQFYDKSNIYKFFNIDIFTKFNKSNLLLYKYKEPILSSNLSII